MGERRGVVGVAGCEGGLEHEGFVAGELALEVDRKNVGVEGDGERQRGLGGGEAGGGGVRTGRGKDEVFERARCGR